MRTLRHLGLPLGAAILLLTACSSTKPTAAGTTVAGVATTPRTTAPTASTAAPTTPAPTTTSPPPTAPPPTLTKVDCAPDRAAPLQCGTVQVPVDPTKPGGALMKVAVTIRPATTAAGQPPVVTLTSAGAGMGYSPSAESAPAWADGREIVWVDRRGAGTSDGYSDCSDILKPYTYDVSVGAPAAAAQAAVASCLTQAAKGAVPFGAVLDLDNIAADLAQVRTALGIKQWVVSTVRSGLDVGVRLLAHDSSGVAALVTADPSFAGGGWNSDSIAASWSAFAADCASTPTCAKYGDMNAAMQAALTRLKPGITINAIDPFTGKATVAKDAVLVTHIDQAFRGSELAYVPFVTANERDGKPGAFEYLNGASIDPGWTKQAAIFMGIVCQDVGLLNAASDGKDAEFGVVGAKQLCPAVTDLPKVVKPLTAPTSEVPVLIGRGTYWPQVQPDRLTAMIKPMAKTQLATFAHTGSVQSAVGCWSTMVTAFLANPASPVDATCAATNPAPAYK